MYMASKIMKSSESEKKLRIWYLAWCYGGPKYVYIYVIFLAKMIFYTHRQYTKPKTKNGFI